MLAGQAAREPWLILCVRREVDGGFDPPEGDAVSTLVVGPLDLERTGQLVELATEEAPLAPHEVVRDFHLVPFAPAVEDGTLTPTRKLRRAEIERRYAREIEELYTFSHRSRSTRT